MTTTETRVTDWDAADDYRTLIAARGRNAAYRRNFFARYFQEGPDDHDEEPREPTLDEINEFARLSAAIAVHHKRMGIDDDAIMRDPDPDWRMWDIEEYKAEYAFQHHPRFQALVNFLVAGKLPDGRHWQEGTPDDLWSFMTTDAGPEFEHLVNAIGGAASRNRLLFEAAATEARMQWDAEHYAQYEN
jgi:hypothetical protein